jgi:hypothetical protein
MVPPLQRIARPLIDTLHLEGGGRCRALVRHLEDDVDCRSFLGLGRLDGDVRGRRRGRRHETDHSEGEDRGEPAEEAHHRSVIESAP